MSQLTKAELLAYSSELASSKAKSIAHEEFLAFSENHKNELIEPDIRDLTIQRAISELILSMCHFTYLPSDSDKESFQEHFENWFATEEEQHLRKLCQGTIQSELKKRSKPGDEDLTFTDKFLRKVREEQKARTGESISSMLKDLYG